MVSTKQALIATEHIHDLQATIFYLDIRACGKDFDQYYERARKQRAITYVKAIPSRVVQMPGTKDLRLRYHAAGGQLEQRDFDLVVLSVGMEPATSAVATAKRLGVSLNDHGFCATDRTTPVSTSRPGVFVAGAFQEPKDIPETVTQGERRRVHGHGNARRRLATPLTVKKAYPPEHDVSDEEPRIGVFVCHCGKNIASVVDVESIANAVSHENGRRPSKRTRHTPARTVA
jgi:heterodisulfide reductase subunit A